MTTLAGLKIRRHRAEKGLTRAEFGNVFSVAGSTVQGWEDEGKRAGPGSANALAALGIADHADWYRQAHCPRCEAESDGEDATACGDSTCPLKPRVAA